MRITSRVESGTDALVQACEQDELCHVIGHRLAHGGEAALVLLQGGQVLEQVVAAAFHGEVREVFVKLQ